MKKVPLILLSVCMVLPTVAHAARRWLCKGTLPMYPLGAQRYGGRKTMKSCAIAQTRETGTGGISSELD